MVKYSVYLLLLILLFLNSCITPPITQRKKKQIRDYFQVVSPYLDYPEKLTYTIRPDNKAIFYSGKIDFSDTSAPEFSHAGISITTKFEGTAIDIILKDESQKNYYLVLIDKQQPILLQTRTGKYHYSIARNLDKGMHTITLFKRTESNCGKSTFYGFALQNDKQLIYPRVSQRKMLFIGDSITTGYGNDRSVVGKSINGFHPRYQNHYNAYGAITSRLLNTQYQAVAYSGIGMFCDATGNTSYTMPRLYKQIHYNEKTILWKAQDYQPDVVVINLGVNDFASESRGNKLDDNQFKKTYQSFIQSVRKDYAQAVIICIVGSMISDNWPAEKRAGSRFQAAVSSLVTQFNQSGDLNVHYVKINIQIDLTGDDYHPSPENHQEMAHTLTEFIKTTMQW